MKLPPLSQLCFYSVVIARLRLIYVHFENFYKKQNIIFCQGARLQVYSSWPLVTPKTKASQLGYYAWELVLRD